MTNTPKHAAPSRWRSTTRTVISAIIGFLPVLAILVDELGLENIPAIAAIAAIAAGLSRALTHPVSARWLTQYVYEPAHSLPPSPPPESDTGDTGRHSG